MATDTAHYLIFSVLFGVIGVTLGSSSGLAFGGGAVNGGAVFGLIGATFGLLLANSKFISGGSEGRNDERSDGEFENGDAQPASDDNNRHLAESASTLIDTALNLAGSLWNLEMALLIRMGLMPHFVRSPWLFGVIGVALLALFMPLGVVYLLTVYAALHFNVKADERFAAQIPRMTA